MNEDQKDFLNFGIGAILLGIANLLALYVLGRTACIGTSESIVACWILVWTIFVVDAMMVLSVFKWSAS